MTLPSSTTSTAGSVTLEPISPASVSTVRTSSTAAFSCLPPQRTIAYTRELSLCLVRALLGCGPAPRQRRSAHTGSQRYEGLACLSTRLAWGSPTPYPSCGQDYQTMRGAQPAAGYAGGPSTTWSPAVGVLPGSGAGVLPASPSRAPCSPEPGSPEPGSMAPAPTGPGSTGPGSTAPAPTGPGSTAPAPTAAGPMPSGSPAWGTSRPGAWTLDS